MRNPFASLHARGGSQAQRLLATFVMLGVVALGLAGVASGSIYTPSIKIPQPLATTADPGQAIFQSHASYPAIEMVCLHVWFDVSDPLDPGEELRFTPNSWLEANPFASGPGYINVGSAPQYQRSLCAFQFPGPPDAFIAEFLDGKQVFKLQAVGSVLICRIDVRSSRPLEGVVSNRGLCRLGCSPTRDPLSDVKPKPFRELPFVEAASRKLPKPFRELGALGPSRARGGP